MEEVDISNLKSCLKCLVSVEKDDECETSYQGIVDQVLPDLNTLVISRPFKNGRPMSAERYPLFVTSKDTIQIVERLKTETKASNQRNSETASNSKALKSPKQQPNLSNYAIINMLNEAQSKSKNGSKSPQVSPNVSHSNGIQLLKSIQSQPTQTLLAKTKPKKQPLQAQSSALSSKQNNGKGPSGNPIIDLLSGHVRHGNHLFDQPINMEELNEDFDFCANLALFQKKDSTSEEGYLDNPDELDEAHVEDEPDDYYRVVYEDKTAPNFRHDENILTDPKRVTSWVNKTAVKTKQSQSAYPNPMLSSTPITKKSSASIIASTPSKGRKTLSTIEKQQVDNGSIVDEYSRKFTLNAFGALPTDNGAILPVLRKSEKQNLLAATTRLYNNSLYSCIVADRFTEFVLDLHRRLSSNSKDMLLIAGESCDPILLHRFTQYFCNREFKIHVYDPPQMPGHLGNNIVEYRDVDELPTDLSTIYFLSSTTFHIDEELRRWILKLSRPPLNLNVTNYAYLKQTKVYPRIVALDFRLFDVKHMHTLYLGAADESVLTAGRIRDNANDAVVCTFEAVVADLGTPYSWISCAESSPAEAFRNSLLCRLSIN